MKLPVTEPASLAAALKGAARGSSMVVGKEVWRSGCMRGRLWKDVFVGVVAEGVEREVMVRFRGFEGV